MLLQDIVTNFPLVASKHSIFSIAWFEHGGKINIVLKLPH